MTRARLEALGCMVAAVPPDFALLALVLLFAAGEYAW